MPDKARNRMVVLTVIPVKKDNGSPWNVRLAALTARSRMDFTESNARLGLGADNAVRRSRRVL